MRRKHQIDQAQLRLKGFFDDDPEEWRIIPGFDGRYEVSNFAHVRRLCSKKSRDGSRKPLDDPKYLKPTIGKGKSAGYVQFHLMRDDETFWTVGAHQLVALAFIGPKPDGCEVNHIDLDKSNNRPWNLEYLTHQQNLIHAHKNKPWDAHRNYRKRIATLEAQVEQLAGK